MLRGKVTNVTSAGVFVQTADFGTIGPCQYYGAKPAAGDAVILADVGDDASPDLVAITGVGRVTIDDSGNTAIPGSLTVSNASGGRFVQISAATSNNADLNFATAGSNRWSFRKSSDAESGSNVGSNFVITRRSDTGSQLSLPIIIWRDTGKVTFGDVGTSAGIELGSSGPTITTGTGAPSHSAPNGSVYLRTDGTSTTTLYIRAAGAWVAK